MNLLETITLDQLWHAGLIKVKGLPRQTWIPLQTEKLEKELAYTIVYEDKRGMQQLTLESLMRFVTSDTKVFSTLRFSSCMEWDKLVTVADRVIDEGKLPTAFRIRRDPAIVFAGRGYVTVGDPDLLKARKAAYTAMGISYDSDIFPQIQIKSRSKSCLDTDNWMLRTKVLIDLQF